MAAILKFGRLPRKENPKTLKLSKYLKTPLAGPHRTFAWEYDVPNWPMMMNDQIGDCTCACAGHMVENWTVRTYGLAVPSDQDILTAYSAVSGYDPTTGVNDNGAAITDVLAYWENPGIAGHKILAWAEVDTTNLVNVKQAISLFGGLDIGFNVPQSAMDEFGAGLPWNGTIDQNIVGGHSVPVFSYGSLGCTCVTWGKLQRMSWAFWNTYVDEAYACVTQDFITAANTSPIWGLDLATLNSDLQALKAA